MARHDRERQKSTLGESHWNASISIQAVVSIRRLYATGFYTQLQIANAFGIKAKLAQRIIKRRRWKHVS